MSRARGEAGFLPDPGRERERERERERGRGARPSQASGEVCVCVLLGEPEVKPVQRARRALGLAVRVDGHGAEPRPHGARAIC